MSRATRHHPGLLSGALLDESSFSVFSDVWRASTISDQGYADPLTPGLSPQRGRGWTAPAFSSAGVGRAFARRRVMDAQGAQPAPARRRVRGSGAGPCSFGAHNWAVKALHTDHRAQTPGGWFRPTIRIAEKIQIISSQAPKPFCGRWTARPGLPVRQISCQALKQAYEQ